MSEFDPLITIGLLVLGCIGIFASNSKILKGVSLVTTILSTIMLNKMLWST